MMMKQLFFLVVAVLFATGVANATTYSGTATATQMNGITVNSTASSDFVLDAKNNLSGNFSVGPHDIVINSTEPVTGTGNFGVSGSITLLGIEIPFSGTATVTTLSSTTLAFTCNVTALGFLASVFSFSGTAS
jgi:hypothetical protein